MKKYLALFLVITLSISFFACGDNSDKQFGTPKNGIFDAPDEFYLDWDIPSVRDISVEKEGNYSMPVYMFETLEELQHLKDIVGMSEIGSEINNTDYCEICYSNDPCQHDKYNDEFFENYTLLIGWHQYAGVYIGEHIQQNPQNKDNFDDEINNEDSAEPTEDPQEDLSTTVSIATYEIAPDGALVVYLQGQKADSSATTQQWVLVAVPKNIIAECDSIAFFVSLPEEE